MPTPTIENRWQSRLGHLLGTPVEVRYEFRTGEPVLADVLDVHKDGCGVSLPSPIETGASVLINGLPPNAHRRVAGRVVWCRMHSSDVYRAGISFFQPLAIEPAPPTQTPDDFYEALEISPSACEETIHYMFRLLEHRYHPDNPRSADAAKLDRVRRAYDVLSKPASREAYDARRGQDEPPARRERAVPSLGEQSAEEKSKRWDLLALLYSRRLFVTATPGLTRAEVEATLGVPREELDFAFWYLQEAGLLEPDHGHNRYSISAKGVDIFESRLEAGLD